MSKKDFWFFGGIFLAIFLFGGFLTFKIFGNQSVYEVIVSEFQSTPKQNISQSYQPTQCSDSSALALEGTDVLEIQKLAYYQSICNFFVTDQLMYFSLIPSEGTVDRVLAKDVRIFLEFKKYGVKPVVVLEPYTADGVMLWIDIVAGKYDASVDKYLGELARVGLISKDFTLIVPLPEPNVPNWGLENRNPEEFGKAYNKIGVKFNEKFPDVQLGVLLNSQTYEAEDVNWDNGVYDYYDAYLNGIRPNLVDVFIMQGFPWVSGASKRKIERIDPNVFLGVDLVPRTLHKLKIKTIWFNTGTFITKYSNDPENKVKISNSARKQILNEIANVSNTLANQGYNVSVNLFAHDKSGTKEGTDWSYATQDQKILIRDFVIDLNNKQIGFSLFDK
jgi:hypothetical protein